LLAGVVAATGALAALGPVMSVAPRSPPHEPSSTKATNRRHVRRKDALSKDDILAEPSPLGS
jgi:hypothetical protein